VNAESAPSDPSKAGANPNDRAALQRTQPGAVSSTSGARGSRSSSQRWQPPRADELQSLLPQYEVTDMLGMGGMGAVYQGRQISLDRPVAIKILSADLEDNDTGFAERFKNEARAMA
jgi:serine/threonine protein kinase